MKSRNCVWRTLSTEYAQTKGVLSQNDGMPITFHFHYFLLLFYVCITASHSFCLSFSPPFAPFCHASLLSISTARLSYVCYYYYYYFFVLKRREVYDLRACIACGIHHRRARSVVDGFKTFFSRKMTFHLMHAACVMKRENRWSSTMYGK